MNTDIVIDGVMFRGCSVASITAESTVSDVTMESGEIGNDHVSKSPVQFALTITFYGNDWVTSAETDIIKRLSTTFNRRDQYIYIMTLWDNKLLFDFQCDLGFFRNMVITHVDVEENNESDSTFKATVNIKQFVEVAFEAAVFQYVTDSSGKVVGASPLGEYDKVTLTKPVNHKVEKDWWGQQADNIGDWGNNHITPYWHLGKVWNWMFG